MPNPREVADPGTGPSTGVLDASDVDEFLADAVELVRSSTGAVSVLALTRDETGLCIAAVAGSQPPPDLEIPAALEPGVELDVPSSWKGVARLVGGPIRDGSLEVLLGWGADTPDPPGLGLVLSLVEATLKRLTAEAQLTDLTARVDNAQQLANMGDYDWHIATNANRWSDQLYRIYGHEPQSFNANYERFLSHIHPDDRERIQAIHQQSYATGEPYQMIERIVRPDGEIRFLSSNGQVVQDAAGTPVRMRGTCVDITEQMLAKQAQESSSARFKALVEKSPDAIVVLDRTGRILQANGRAGELLGGDPLGRSIREVLSWPPDQPALGLLACGLDGRRLQLDVATAALGDDEDGQTVAAFLHDASPRLQGESIAARLREAQVRRRQALELNDSVIQGLTAAVLSMQSGDPASSARFLGHTLSAARKMMNEWLDPLEGGDLSPGDLIRATASTFDPLEATVTHSDDRHVEEIGADRPEILLVEDNVDVRRLLRAKLESTGAYQVVGEAGDGQEALELAAQLRPSVVLLDLAMPRMDGMTALPLILAAVPDVRVIVLSGFDQATMAERALAAGAHAYVEKGLRMDLDQAIRDVLEPVVHRHSG